MTVEMRSGGSRSANVRTMGVGRVEKDEGEENCLYLNPQVMNQDGDKRKLTPKLMQHALNK